MAPLAPAPTKVLHVDADGGLPELDRLGSVDDEPYRAARLYVWHRGRPIGFVDAPLEPPPSRGEISARVAALVHEAAGTVQCSGSGQRSVDIDPSTAATIVLATRHRPASLLRCIRSIRAIDGPPPRILVVDSAPDDDRALRVLQDHLSDDPDLRYVRAHEPGLATAHNVAIPHLDTEFVLITDDDVIVDRRWVAAMLAAFADESDAMCATGLILPAELDTQTQCLIEASAGFDKGLDRQVFDLGPNRPGDTLFPFTAGAFGSGANMAFRTEYLRSIGGFDPLLGAGAKGRGGDDLAAFIDVIVRGHRLVYEPAAAVFHHHHRTPEALERQARGYGVGFSAAVTSTIRHHPKLAVQVARRLPSALRYATSSDSPKNARLPEEYPGSLRRRELIGMASGPFAYGRGWWSDRRPGPAGSDPPIVVGRDRTSSRDG